MCASQDAGTFIAGKIAICPAWIGRRPRRRSGAAWYFSRSRRALWKKGETSGHTQRVVEMRVDCDQDAVWIKVEQAVAACHTGRRSCFYRAVPLGKSGSATLEFRDDRVFDPKTAYRKD
jgi:phosphoribosyl-AMP cyclohydrolase